MGLLNLEPISNAALGQLLYPAIAATIKNSLGENEKINELHHYLNRYQNPFDPYNLIEKMDAGICLFEPPGRFVYANDKTVEALGFERHELLGNSWYEFIHPDYRHLIIENKEVLFRFKRFNWIKVLASGKNGKECRIRTKGKLLMIEGTPCVLAIQLWEHFFHD